jgi:parvulin-like peptidyl-prolyl isomerase
VTTVRKPLVLFAAAVLALLVVGSGCSAVTPYAAKVNGDRIRVRDLNRELNAIKGNAEYLKTFEATLGRQGESPLGAGKGTFGSTFVAQMLTQRIYLELVHQELERRSLRVPKEKLDEARRSLAQSPEDEALLKKFPKAYLDELARISAEVSVLRESLATEVSDADIRKFYDENPQFFEQVCARQIVTGGFTGETPPAPDQEAQAKATADDIKGRLDAGQDFAAIATVESKDPQSAPQGGDLGCVSGNAFPPEVAASVESTENGKVAGPIRTDRGFYLVLVQSRAKQPLEEVAAQIRQYLEQQAGDPLNTFLAKALADAEISVNPRYGTFDRNSPRPSVVPPEAPRLPPSEPPIGEPPNAPEEGAPVQ